jgi:hypothetical protein
MGSFSRTWISAVTSLLVLSNLISVPAHAIMNGQVAQTSSRVVPIFISPNESSSQQSKTVAYTGFLYSSRIVFTAIPDYDFDGNGNKVEKSSSVIYVGKPGSDTSDTSGRVKVIKRLYSQSFRNEGSKLGEFGILILEKDLISARSFPLLTKDMERELAKSVKITGYGEFQDQCSGGQQPPCRDKPFEPSSKPRSVTVSKMPLSELESILDYKQPQLVNQMVFYNRQNPRAGAVCFGDSGAPIIGEYRNTSVYLGQMSSAVRIYGCGRGIGFDGKGGIHYASPVYEHFGLIREAEAFVLAQSKVNAKAGLDPVTSLPAGTTTVSLKTSKATEHEGERVNLTYIGDLSDKNRVPEGFRFFNSYGGKLLQVNQILSSKANCTTSNSTTLKCSFPSFNPYTNILIKESGVALHAAPYNRSGQGPLSPAVNMYEWIWTSNFGSIGFVDSAKVIKDIFGSETFSKNVGGFISKSTESKAEVKFIFQGPPLSKGVTPKIVFTEVGYTQKVTAHKMGITGYKYLNGNHQFEYQSREKIKFAGNSRFNAELQIVDETGFVRGRESTFFTYGYKMKWWCSLGILGGVPGRTISKLSLKTAITGFNLANLYTDLLPVEKRDKVSFLKNFFNSPEFIAERGLAAIEVLEEPDGNVNFKIYIQDQALDIRKELAESFLKKVIKESRFGQTSGNASIAGWNFLMSAEDSIILLTDYYTQVDDWNKRNAEIIIEVCAKS